MGRHVVNISSGKEWMTRTTYVVHNLSCTQIVLRKLGSDTILWKIPWPLKQSLLYGKFEWVPSNKKMAREHRFRTGNYQKTVLQPKQVSEKSHQPMCCVCMTHFPIYVFQPCMHATYCEECRNDMATQEPSMQHKCPVCRTTGNPAKVFW